MSIIQQTVDKAFPEISFRSPFYVAPGLARLAGKKLFGRLWGM